MVETGKSQGPVSQMIEAVAIADAADAVIKSAATHPAQIRVIGFKKVQHELPITHL